MNYKQIEEFCKQNGMSYNIMYKPIIMEMIRTNILTMDEISQYGDVICKHNAKNINFLKEQISDYEDMVKNIKEKDLNPTTIGNCAYIAIHSPEPYKSYLKKVYDTILNHIKS